LCAADVIVIILDSIPVPNSLRITDYNRNSIILDPYKITNPINQFTLTEDWYDTIEVLLNPDVYSGIQQGIKDAQMGRFTNELS